MANEQVTVRFAAEIQQYQRNVTQAQKLLKLFGISAEQEANRVSKSVAAMVAQYASLTLALNAVKNVVKEGIDFNKFTEVSTAAFGTMMKSVSGAKAVMQDLFNFAVNSPLTFKETVAASRQMMAYGFQVKELIPTIQMLGTVGKATGVSLDDMAYVYGTLRSQGRAYTRDLMQFAMRGIPIYEELAKVMGVPVAQLQKMTEAGKIGFKEVEKAFQNMTSGTGKFAGYFDEYMKTFEGKMSMLTDIFQQAAGSLTSSLFDVLKKNIDDFITLIKNNQKAISSLGKDLGNIASGFLNIAKALLPLLPLLIKIIPLLIAKELASVGIRAWKVLPEILTEIAGGFLKIGATKSIWPDIAAGMALVKESFVSTLPAIIALIAPIATVAAGIAGIAVVAKMANDRAKEVQNKYATDKTYTAGAVSSMAATSGANSGFIDKYAVGGMSKIKLSLQEQIELIRKSQKMYSSLSMVEYAEILFKNKAITKEARDQIVLQETMIANALKLSESKQAEYKAASGIYDKLKDQANVISSTMGVGIEKFQVRDFNFQYYGANAANEYIKGFKSAAQEEGALYKSLGITLPKKDIKKAAQDEFDAILATVTSLKSAMGENGEKLFPNLEGNSLFPVLAARLQELEKLIASLGDTTEKAMPKMDKFFAWEWDVKASGDQIEALRLEYAKFHDAITKKEDITEAERVRVLLDLDIWYQKEKNKIAMEGYKEEVEVAEKAAESIYDVWAKQWDRILNGNDKAFRDKTLQGGMAMAAQSGDIGGLVKLYAQSKFNETGVGKLVSGYKDRAAGTDTTSPIGTGMNVFITAMQALGGPMKALLDFLIQIVMAAEPMQDFLKAITISVTYALMPTIESLAQALSWLYDSIIVPVGNMIIDLFNALIRFYNSTIGKWTNTHINEMRHLLTTTEALAKAQEDEAKKIRARNAMDALTETIDYLRTKLDDMVGSQIRSLQDLYEVGAISADTYSQRVAEVSGPYKERTSVSTADQALSTMPEIYRRLVDLEAVKQNIDTGKVKESDIEALLKRVGIEYNSPAMTISEGVYNALKAYGAATTVSSKTVPNTKKQTDFLRMNPPSTYMATGTGNVPQNMPANIHKGEMIIPSDFSSAIRRGDLNLSRSGSSGGNSYTIIVEGSVTTERDLITAISKGIDKQKKWGFA